MTDTTVVELPKPARRRPGRPKKPSAVAVAEAPKQEVDEFPGMTFNECCSTCQMDRCAITGKAYCGHPYKGGLRYADMGDPACVSRMQRAKAKLARIELEKRMAQV